MTLASGLWHKCSPRGAPLPQAQPCGALAQPLCQIQALEILLHKQIYTWKLDMKFLFAYIHADGRRRARGAGQSST